MKKLINSIPAKITAFMLSLAFVIIFLFSVLTLLLMVNYQFYFSNEKTVKSEILTDMANREGNYISYRFDTFKNLKDYYGNKNVYYEIINTNGELLESNYKGEKYIASATVEHYSTAEIPSKDEYGNTYFEYIHTADINVYIAEDMKHNDTFSLVAKIIHIGFKLQYFMILIAVLSLGILIALFSFLFCAAGHNSDGRVKLNYLDKLPFDVYSVFVAVVVMANLVLISEMGYNQVPAIAFLFMLACIDYCIGLGYLLSIATRIKTGTLFKNTLIYRIFKGLKDFLRKPISFLKFTVLNLSVVKKTILIIIGIAFLELLFIIYARAMIYRYEWDFVILAVVVISLILFAVLLYFAVVLQKIKKGGEEISGGNLGHKIDTQYMFGDFKEFSENINNINSTLQIAVNERMKSEHFKVELITNVSHDIKTPLTSIINYVDLIKKEEIENETVIGYLQVLDRQSGRLKKLVEDLVEASKASSGNLPVELTPCNVGVLLTQTIGEFEEKLQKAGVTPVLKMSSENVTVLADGRHLWRVFDNLLNNVCKYAMEGTRVYITVAENSKGTEIIFRNISKYQLNITAEELMERFVRGDKSRNSEGHGLGLSIVRSLLELQNGRLELSVDGDLFKATVIFDK